MSKGLWRHFSVKAILQKVRISSIHLFVSNLYIISDWSSSNNQVIDISMILTGITLSYIGDSLGA